ncbi:MAG: hypothetical protein IJE85_04255 [Bacteroidales bacterium]|nr:hypothetical protein [Bacteroidales bacterium]
METIIGLLFILLPVIFKLIGKKLEQSGHTGQAETIRKIAEALGDDAEAECDEDGQIVHLPEQPSAKPSVQPQPVVPVRVVQEEGKQGIIRKPLLVEEKDEVEKEKIDPKKLVIYSEIMKPKF